MLRMVNDRVAVRDMNCLLVPPKRAKPCTATLPLPPSTQPGPHRVSTSSSPGNGGSLRALLRRDVEPTGPRVVLCFLTTADRLRLSECARDFMVYRSQLSCMRIVQHPSANARLKRAFVAMLGDQQAGIAHLHVAYRPVVSWLDQQAWRCCRRLRVLDMSSIELQNKDAAFVGKALSQGALENLEELIISSGSFTGYLTAIGLASVIKALSQGACPRLRRLVLSCEIGAAGAGAGEGVAASLEAGYGRWLQELELSRTFLGPQNLSGISRALERSSCPDLRRLTLSGCHLVLSDGQALGAALRSGACRKLEVLELANNPHLDDGAVDIMDALAAGACPHLQHMDLRGTHVMASGGTALARALSGGKCSSLRFLSLQEALLDPVGTLRILEAIKGGSCPDLRHLNLTITNMDDEHGRVLGEAFGSGACSTLEELKLSGNVSLGDRGIVHIAAALEAGGCPILKRLEVFCAGMGSIGAAALARALASGSLRHLEDIDFIDNDALGGHAVAEVMRAVGLGACPKLLWVDAFFTDSGESTGQAVVEALRDGSWMLLENICLIEKPFQVGSPWGVEAGKHVEGRPQLDHSLSLFLPVSGDGLRWLTQAFRQGACPSLKGVAIKGALGGEKEKELLKELEASVQGRVKVKFMAME